MTYVPTVHINGVRLTGVKIHETRDASGLFVSTVHIDAPDFDVREKDTPPVGSETGGYCCDICRRKERE